eukprot:TRINITY_DN20249_c0_g2_i2.p1 TRINITY_DN20249_c0_g2~~TRINITY_DN20249_c0_g2_i2.p1  ORF type:complete len:368 (+),score=56.69 TRINITY_DN20249_c0_g2_i2:61-1104(+)
MCIRDSINAEYMGILLASCQIKTHSLIQILLMCITFFHLEIKEGKVSFILAFNREENLERPTLPLAPWEEDPYIVGGRDLKFRGSWLALNIKTGNIAFLTNLRGRTNKLNTDPRFSRGALIHDYVKSDFYGGFIGTPEEKEKDFVWRTTEYLKGILKNKAEYNGFNLLAGNLIHGRLFYICSEPDWREVLEVKEGTHVVDNWSYLEPRAAKSLHGLKTFDLARQELFWENKQELTYDKIREMFLKMMEDKTTFGEGMETSIFVERYWNDFFKAWRGTGTTTIMILRPDGEFEISERNHAVGYSSQTDPLNTTIRGRLGYQIEMFQSSVPFLLFCLVHNQIFFSADCI